VSCSAAAAGQELGSNFFESLDVQPSTSVQRRVHDVIRPCVCMVTCIHVPFLPKHALAASWRCLVRQCRAIAWGVHHAWSCSAAYMHIADAGEPACVSGSAGDDAERLQVHETTGMASVIMTCSNVAGRRYIKHPAAADLHPRPHSSTHPRIYHLYAPKTIHGVYACDIATVVNSAADLWHSRARELHHLAGSEPSIVARPPVPPAQLLSSAPGVKAHQQCLAPRLGSSCDLLVEQRPNLLHQPWLWDVAGVDLDDCLPAWKYCRCSDVLQSSPIKAASQAVAAHLIWPHHLLLQATQLARHAHGMLQCQPDVHEEPERFCLPEGVRTGGRQRSDGSQQEAVGGK
jgi:hypothetical protein